MCHLYGNYCAVRRLNCLVCKAVTQRLCVFILGSSSKRIMGWLGDLYEGAKSTVGNVYNAVKNTLGNVVQTAKNWSQGKYTAPGGYRYCGPGNDLDEGEPINASDSACRQHDLDYDRFRKAKDAGKIGDKELRDLVRESDERLIGNLRQDPNRDIGSYLSELGIQAKKKAEDWGLISPERFVV